MTALKFFDLFFALASLRNFALSSTKSARKSTPHSYVDRFLIFKEVLKNLKSGYAAFLFYTKIPFKDLLFFKFCAIISKYICCQIFAIPQII